MEAEGLPADTTSDGNSSGAPAAPFARQEPPSHNTTGAIRAAEPPSHNTTDAFSATEPPAHSTLRHHSPAR